MGTHNFFPIVIHLFLINQLKKINKKSKYSDFIRIIYLIKVSFTLSPTGSLQTYGNINKNMGYFNFI